MDELKDTVYYPSALGRKARSIIQVLRRTGPVDSVTELADRAGTTPRTVRRKLDKLEELEVTDSEKRGRSRSVWLQKGWKDRLEEYRCEAPTWLRDIDRRIKHKEEQIKHEYQSDLQKEGDLRTVPFGSGGQKVLLPVDVIRYINLERKCREKVEIRRLNGRAEEADRMLDELAELQGQFDDRVNKLANDLLDLIREALQRQREKWGVIDD
jgi:DNA-binding transcriptional ArsR family regulator